MKLREVIEILERRDPDQVVHVGFAAPNSYRGYYDSIAFTPAIYTTVGAMLAHARSAVGTTFHGYKGGEYTMTLDTDCYVAAWGDYNGNDDKALLEKILRDMRYDQWESKSEAQQQLERDAARYRWLRHGDNDELVIRGNGWLPRNDTLDALIDREMAKEKK